MDLEYMEMVKCKFGVFVLFDWLQGSMRFPLLGNGALLVAACYLL